MLAYYLLALLPLVAAAPQRRWPKSTLAGAAEHADKLYFGTEVSSYYFSDPRFTSAVSTEFNQYTPENEMKWEVIEPERGVFNWTGSDLIFDEARKNHAPYIRGHNFVWHQQTPAYVTNITDPNELKEVLTEHVQAVMGRYGSQLYAFDVINEPLYDNGTFRESVWYNLLGEDYLRIALEIAHAAAPDVKLYINDYNIESTNNKSLAYVEIAKKLLAQGAPLHGIGFESHFIAGETPADIGETMALFTDLGLNVAITELDVRVPVGEDGKANSTWLAIQAQDYGFVVDACLRNDKCPGITVWGFEDTLSWIPGVFPGEGAADLYDNYVAKPALAAVRKVLSQVCWS